MDPTRILLVDDHRLFSSGIRALINRAPGFEVTGEAADAPSALEACAKSPPDIAVVDVHLPGEVDGIEAARLIRERCPATKIVFLSSDSDFAVVRRAIEAGGQGYLLKEDTSQDLIQALTAVKAGGVHLSPAVAAALVDDYRHRGEAGAPAGAPALSKREREVLLLLADGMRNKEIAEQLGVGVKSVETYRSRLLLKLNLSSTAELARYAVREGLIKP